VQTPDGILELVELGGLVEGVGGTAAHRAGDIRGIEASR
jgi:hypothetical protein